MAVIFFLICMLFQTGCGKKGEVKKIKDLTFQILSREQVGDELAGMLEQKKSKPFKITYQEDGKLYICIGYGRRDSGGYSITVNELFLASNAVYVDTSLMGPDKEEEKIGGTSYPYIIIQTEDMDKTVVFQ